MEEIDKNFDEKEEEIDPEKVDELEDPEAGFAAEEMFGDEAEASW